VIISCFIVKVSSLLKPDDCLMHYFNKYVTRFTCTYYSLLALEFRDFRLFDYMTVSCSNKNIILNATELPCSSQMETLRQLLPVLAILICSVGLALMFWNSSLSKHYYEPQLWYQPA